MGNKGKGGLCRICRMGRFAVYFCCAVVLLACAPVTERVQPGAPVQLSGPDNVRTDDEIQAVFEQNKSKFYKIYKSFLRAQPDLVGKIEFSITIEPAGQVSECKVHKTSFKDPAMGKEMCTKIQSFIFGSNNMAPISITYPIDFL